MRFYLGHRLPGGFYGGVSFNPTCKHCGQRQPFHWSAFIVGILLTVVLLAFFTK